MYISVSDFFGGWICSHGFAVSAAADEERETHEGHKSIVQSETAHEFSLSSLKIFNRLLISWQVLIVFDDLIDVWNCKALGDEKDY